MREELEGEKEEGVIQVVLQSFGVPTTLRDCEPLAVYSIHPQETSLSGSCLPTYFSLSHTVRVLSDSHVCIVMQMIPSHSYGSTLNLFLPPVSLLLAKSFPVCGRHTGPSLDFQTKKSQHTDFTSTFKTVCDEYFLPTFSVTRLGENCAGLAIFYSLGYILNNLSI